MGALLAWLAGKSWWKFLRNWWEPVVLVVAALGIWAWVGHELAARYKKGYAEGVAAEQRLTSAKIAGALAADAEERARERERQNEITKENADAHRKEMEEAVAANDSLRKRLDRLRLCPAVSAAGVPTDQAGANAIAADAVRPPGSESWSHEAGLGFIAPIILNCEQDAIDYDGLVDWYKRQRAESLHAAGISTPP